MTKPRQDTAPPLYVGTQVRPSSGGSR